MALVWRGLGRARVPVTVRRLQPTLLLLPPLRTLVLSRSGPAQEQQRGSMGKRGPKPKTKGGLNLITILKVDDVRKHVGNVFNVPWGWWEGTAPADEEKLCKCLVAEWDNDFKWTQKGETAGAVVFQRHDDSGDTTLYHMHIKTHIQ